MSPKGREKLQRLLNQLLRYDLLVLDELGYVPFSKVGGGGGGRGGGGWGWGVGAELLFEVVSGDYERQSLIVTTNLSFENWWMEVMNPQCGSEAFGAPKSAQERPAAPHRTFAVFGS